MEREVGGGIGMGNTCKPMAVSFQCMTKFTTNKKKMKITTSGPSTSWQIEREEVEAVVTHCVFLAPKSLWMVTAAMELKHVCLHLRRKAMRNLGSVLKSGDVPLLTKFHIVKSPVVMYGCESWTIKKSRC